jgi:threonine dehydrogenase-like Zn-dependent dehydrogenase
VAGVDPNERCRQAAEALAIDAYPETGALPGASRGAFDLHLECSGSERAVLDALPCLRSGAEISLVGVPWRPHGGECHALLDAVFRQYLTLRSGWEWQLAFSHATHPRTTTREAVGRSLDWVASRTADLQPLIATVSPRDCQQVYDDIRAGRLGRPFVCFDWH